MKLHHAIIAAAAMTVATAHAMLPTPEAVSSSGQLEQTFPKIDQKINAFVVRTDASGAEVLQPLTAGDNVQQGDIVEYQGLFTNQDTNRVRSVTVTLGIPEGAELVGGVSPSIAKGSIDGQRYVNMPIRATLNGQAQELPLTYYKGLRWTVEDLGIGATAVVKYRARIK